MRALDFVKQSPQKIHKYLKEKLNRKEYTQWWEVGSISKDDVYAKFCSRLELFGFTRGREFGLFSRERDYKVVKKLPILYLNRYSILIDYKCRLIMIDFNYCGGGEWVTKIEVKGQVD